MFKYFLIYILVLAGIGIYNFFRVKGYDEFVVAGRRQSQPFILMSLLSTMLGASATFGVVDMAYHIGFPAFWWLSVGAAGLILQSMLLSEKVRAFNAYTLPDIAKKTIGDSGKVIIALIIVISWTGIIAAQFVALSKIFSIITGNTNNTALLLVTAVIVIIYTMVGGQLSVIKTDSIQFVILSAGFIFTFGYLFLGFEPGNITEIFSRIELANADFSWINIINLLFIVGGTYFIGPDVFSRNLAARDGKVAKKAALHAGVVLFFFSFIIVLIGLWTKVNVVNLGQNDPLIYLIFNHLPPVISVIMSIGLISVLISSADTCLISTAAIIGNDILKRTKLTDARIFVLGIGTISLLIAVLKKDIISLLLSAYSVYAPGIVFPLFTAIWFHNKKEINKTLLFAAIIVGGSFGLLSSYFNIEFLPLIGMGCSLVLSVLSVYVSPAHINFRVN
jgi:SSS family solute:Na+ symporter